MIDGLGDVPVTFKCGLIEDVVVAVLTVVCVDGSEG